MKKADLQMFVGKKVTIIMAGGCVSLNGYLLSVDDTQVVMKVKNDEQKIPLSLIDDVEL